MPRRNVRPAEAENAGRISARAENGTVPREPETDDPSVYMLAAIPFWAVAGTTLANGLILSAFLLVTLLPASALRYALRHAGGRPEWVSLPAAVLLATATVALCQYPLAWLVEASVAEPVGGSLYLLAAAPVLMNAECTDPPGNARRFWRRTFHFVAEFVLVMLPTSILRELLGLGTVLGRPAGFMGGFRLGAVRYPFFGLLFAGFLLALIRRLPRLMRKAVGRRSRAEERAAREGGGTP